jgi:U3 small nucleolar RNA-associated protein 7
LHYLDVSIGKIVAAFPTGRGSLDVMTQNPANAIVLLGDSRGRVSMWSPNAKEPLVEMLVHQSPVRGVAVDQTGLYMATVGLDRRMRYFLARL